MRVLHIVHQFLPEFVGGTELYTRTLAEQQVLAGLDVAIFTPDMSPITTHVPIPTVESGVRVYRVGVGPRGDTAVFQHTFRHTHLHHTWQQILHQEQPDLIHIQHLKGLPISLVATIQEANIPYIITLHDYWHLCANAQLLTNYDQTNCTGPQAWINCARCALARANLSWAVPTIPGLVALLGYRQVLLRRVLLKASSLIVPTRFVQTALQPLNLPDNLYSHIPHGIQIPAELPPHQPTSNKLQVAYIGGISWQKGVHVLIKAFNQLPEEYGELHIYGDTAVFPEYVAKLKEMMTHPGIQLHGRLPHSQLWHTLARVDVVVVPSIWYETASLIIQEAFAAGVPVLASRLGALQERVVDGVDGRFFSPGNDRELANILLELWQQPEQLTHLRSGIQPVHTITDHLHQILNQYQRVITTDQSD